MSDDDVLSNFEWNQVESGFEYLNNGLLSILAFRPDRTPCSIGTAFLIVENGRRAVAISAAHVFLGGVDAAQRHPARHHPTALEEFLPQSECFSVDGGKLLAIHLSDSRAEACIVEQVVIDQSKDIAIFSLRAQNEEVSPINFNTFLLGGPIPKIRDIVFAAGFAEMKTLSSEVAGAHHRFSTQRRLLVRCGRIKALHPDGHIGCRGPCIETTIPIFSGMSGGPVFNLGKDGEKIEPFGILCTDPDEPDELKNDRSRAGSSIVSLLPLEIVSSSVDRRETLVQLDDLRVIGGETA